MIRPLVKSSMKKYKWRLGHHRSVLKNFMLAAENTVKYTRIMFRKTWPKAVRLLKNKKQNTAANVRPPGTPLFNIFHETTQPCRGRFPETDVRRRLKPNKHFRKPTIKNANGKKCQESPRSPLFTSAKECFSEW